MLIEEYAKKLRTPHSARNFAPGCGQPATHSPSLWDGTYNQYKLQTIKFNWSPFPSSKTQRSLSGKAKVYYQQFHKKVCKTN